ncbi:unnamed protein product [Effrenium voratum]|nr:unnamed protein product [Effrenium voratum]
MSWSPFVSAVKKATSATKNVAGKVRTYMQEPCKVQVRSARAPCEVQESGVLDLSDWVDVHAEEAWEIIPQAPKAKVEMSPLLTRTLVI